MISEYFKYGSVLSIPLFSLIALFLIQKAKNFSFSKHTVSKSVLFLDRTMDVWIFRFNFFIKSFLDLGFFLYLLQRHSIPLLSPIAWVIVLPAPLFGLLGYFTEKKNHGIHLVLIYSTIVFWQLSEIILAMLTKNYLFQQITWILACIPFIVAFWFLFVRKTNVLVQMFCIIMNYCWLLYFVSNYL